ncbi:MAG: hypothetical protein ACERKD_20240 [Prolixibacteraceae bacterium]
MMIKAVVFGIFLFGAMACTGPATLEPINRKAVVERNNVSIEGFDSLASLSVGNGNFTFTTDLTGLQTFYAEYDNGVSLGTMSNWAWHSFPNTENYQWDETNLWFDVEGRKVPYRHQLKNSERAKQACDFFRANPHKIHLGLIGLDLRFPDGRKAQLADITNAQHQLDLWTGKITSDFTFDQKPVHVEVYCHQDVDLISVNIQSPLVKTGQLAVEWNFPAPEAKHTGSGINMNSPEMHKSTIVNQENNGIRLKRQLDADEYFIEIDWTGAAQMKQVAQHQFILSENNSEQLQFSCLFSPDSASIPLPDFKTTETNSTNAYAKYWSNGGFVDFSFCTDPRAKELERRVILSQYLTKIQSTGDLPPAETGLTFNSWYGKFHLEMHWWHVAHFAQWQRGELIEKQLDYYFDIMGKARQTASDQGYEGVRWPKMIGPEGENSPSSVGSYLIWQQPHIIWLAEQMYRQNESPEVLKKYEKLIVETANFMADVPIWNEEKGWFDLAPPLIPAQEHWERTTTYNPPFELAYWYWGLTTAQNWMKRLGQPQNEQWEKVRLHMAKPDTANGVYLGIEGATESYTDETLMRDHPMVLGAYGMLPAWDEIDPDIMRATLITIAEKWNWPNTWGWDYPMAAMSAVRLEEPELALDLLLKNVQKNIYLKNGHNYQDKRLRIYLPGNGGLLETVAMMCAGWDGCEIQNPGFPKDGKWKVKWENLTPVF